MQPDPSPISLAALCASAATSVRLTAHQTAFCAALSKRLPELNLTERERGIIDRIEARIQSDVWSPSIIDKMAELWGLSAQRIGERIGVSKNAVLGKTHRLFKAGDLRFPPKTLTTIRPASNRDPVSHRPRHTLPSLASGPAAMDVPVVRLDPRRGCQWATTSRRPWTFCNEPVMVGKSYCPTHCRIVFVPVRDAPRRPDEDKPVRETVHLPRYV